MEGLGLESLENNFQREKKIYSRAKHSLKKIHPYWSVFTVNSIILFSLMPSEVRPLSAYLKQAAWIGH